jgi:hypothetical protein
MGQIFTIEDALSTTEGEKDWRSPHEPFSLGFVGVIALLESEAKEVVCRFDCLSERYEFVASLFLGFDLIVESRRVGLALSGHNLDKIVFEIGLALHSQRLPASRPDELASILRVLW